MSTHNLCFEAKIGISLYTLYYYMYIKVGYKGVFIEQIKKELATKACWFTNIPLSLESTQDLVALVTYPQ